MPSAGALKRPAHATCGRGGCISRDVAFVLGGSWFNCGARKKFRVFQRGSVMSTLPRKEQQSIEDILEQIRKEAAAVPLSHVERLRNAPHQNGGAHEPSGASAEGAHQHPVDALAQTNDPEWTWSGAAPEGSDLREEGSPDLPSVLRRAADHVHSASVHTFPRTPRSRLTEALRRVRAPAASPSAKMAAPSTSPETQTIDGLAGQPPAASLEMTTPPSEPSPVKREMTSFLDTRFKNLSVQPVASKPEVATEKAPGISASELADQDEASELKALIEALGKTPADALSRSQLGAAELLRPMLKQWLLENMPRIVEKALSMEMAENAGKT